MGKHIIISYELQCGDFLFFLKDALQLIWQVKLAPHLPASLYSLIWIF